MVGRSIIFSFVFALCTVAVFARQTVEYPGGQFITYENGEPVDYWRVIDGYSVRIKDLVLAGNELSVIIISQREGDLRTTTPLDPVASDTSLNYVPSIFSYVRHFAIHTYETRFGKEIGDLVRRERDFLNGVSNMVVVCEKNNLGAIVGTFRTVHRGNQPQNLKLDLETEHKIDLPSLPIRIEERGGEQVAAGDWVENKTLIKDEKAPPSLYDFLWVIMDDYGFYEDSNRAIVHQGKKVRLLPDHVSHEAAPAQQRLYRRSLKFKSLKEFPNATDNPNVQWHSVIDLKRELGKLREKLGDDYRKFRQSKPVFGWNRLPLYHRDLLELKSKLISPQRHNVVRVSPH